MLFQTNEQYKVFQMEAISIMFYGLSVTRNGLSTDGFPSNVILMQNISYLTCP